MNTPFLEAFDSDEEGRSAPVAPDVARARMRSSLGAEELDVLEDDARFRWMRLARAGGKTTTMVSDALDKMSAVRDWRGCYGSLTKDSGLEQLWDELRRQDKAFGFGLKFVESQGIVYYTQTGARLRVRSLDNLGEVNKWRGKQYHDVYVDECQSIDDAALRYAIVTVLPPTLSRHKGRMLLGGTPRMDCSGWWFELTGPNGLMAAERPDGGVRANARLYRDRKRPEYVDGHLDWAWSGHNWPRSSNPGLPDADRESDTLRRALSVTPEDAVALSVELDGEWPAANAKTRIYRYVPAESNRWRPGPAEENYGLPDGHDWGFYLGADLGFADEFAVEIFAAAITSRRAWHCDEFHQSHLEVSQMAGVLKGFMDQLGTRLHAMVGDSQGGTGHRIFEELSTVHGIPLERAEKRDKDDAVELWNDDLTQGRVVIIQGSRLEQQLLALKKTDPTKRVSQQPKQRDDCADAALYARRRMLHVFGKDPAEVDPEAAKKAGYRRQLKAMEARRRATSNPWTASRGGAGSNTRPW